MIADIIKEMLAEYAEAADLNRALAEEHMEAFNEVVEPLEAETV